MYFYEVIKMGPLLLSVGLQSYVEYKKLFIFSYICLIVCCEKLCLNNESLIFINVSFVFKSKLPHIISPI